MRLVFVNTDTVKESIGILVSVHKIYMLECACDRIENKSKECIRKRKKIKMKGKEKQQQICIRLHSVCSSSYVNDRIICLYVINIVFYFGLRVSQVSTLTNIK